MTKQPDQPDRYPTLRALFDGMTPDQRRRIASIWAHAHPDTPEETDDD